MVEVVRSERPWVTCVLAEAADVCAIIDSILLHTLCCAIPQSLDDVEECAVEGLGVVEGLIQETVGDLSVVGADLVDADSQSSQTAIEHEQNLRLVAAGARILCVFVLVDGACLFHFSLRLTWVQELLSGADAISHRLITKLYSVHREFENGRREGGEREVCCGVEEQK